MLAVAILAVSASAVSIAQETRVIEIVEVDGVIDDRKAEFLIETLDAAADGDRVELVILAIDSPAVTADRTLFDAVRERISGADLPVVAWVGDAPAVATGGVLDLVLAAPLRAAAPGVSIGLWNGGPDFPPTSDLVPEAIAAAGLDRLVAEVSQPIPGVIDLVQAETASPRQLIQLLDGRRIGQVEVSTLRPYTDQEGASGVTALPVVIREPGALASLAGLAARPEALFFFLVMALVVAVFEFYAIGPGIAAGVSAVCLGLAAAGMTALPIRPWSPVLIVASILLLAMSYQRGGVAVLNGLGLIGLTVGGFTLVAGGELLRPPVVATLLTPLAAAFFFLLAMPVVARSRFSTRTIGRENLIGRVGVAVSDFSPEGEVEVDGGRWRATSHRESHIRSGDRVVVLGVDGWMLEVDPVPIEENAKKVD